MRRRGAAARSLALLRPLTSRAGWWR
jgi:hypothetical protein